MWETKEAWVCGRGRNNGEQIKGETRRDEVLCGRARGRRRREADDVSAEWMQRQSWIYGGGRYLTEGDLLNAVEMRGEKKTRHWMIEG